MRAGVFFVIVFSLFTVSCSSWGRQNSDAYVIRYVDLARVYAYAVQIDKGKNIANSDDQKKRIYGRIKTAVSSVAKRHNADFIINTGDALLYSRSVYDLTGEVIREYKTLIDIKSPENK